MFIGSTEEDFSCFTIKGRRTKRQRSLLVASATSSHRGGSDDSYGSSSSPSQSDEHDVMSEVTSEEEDMANCLILLAQGIKKKTSKHNNVTNTSNKNNIGMSYECKTCNKTFSSFQALGGHRTSHKKIKPPSSTPISSSDHHEDHRDVVVDYLDEDFTSVKKIVEHHQHKARVHECSICGSEFPSGQALGGHMRRHRAAVPLPPPVTTVSIGFPVTSEVAGTAVDTGGPGNILCLDLNLPAPDHDDDQDDDHQRVYDEDDHHVDNTFVHVLPRMSTLLDCHY